MNFVGNPYLMKQLNRSAILGLLRERGPLSRSDVAKILNLSPPTVTRIVNQLIEEGLLCEGETTEPVTKIGRPPTLLYFNFSAYMVIGVDVGGTKTTGAVADLHGDIVYRKTIPSIPDGDRSRSLSSLLDFLGELLEAAPVPREKVRGIGVGVPSVVLSKDHSVAWAPAFGWRNVPLKNLVEDRFGISAFIENDVNLATLGESQFGIGRGVQNLVCIFVGTGIGGGLILNGELYRGYEGAAGEVGYMIPRPDFLQYSYDDEFGCLESLAAGPGVVRRAKEAVQAGTQTSLNPGNDNLEELTAKQVFQAARDGDALAQAIVTETANYLAQAVANVACTLNPEMIILGGALTRSGDLLLEPIRECVRRVVPFVPEIVLTELGDDAVLYGAIALAIRATREHISVQGNAT